MTTDALDSRVRRLENILAGCAREAEGASSQDESAASVALKHFSASLKSVQQLTDEVRSRVGAGEWDAADALAARLLLEALTSALRSCRIVSHQTTARLFDVQRAADAGHETLRLEIASRRQQ
jgi:hypothetical protein